MKVLFLDIDGVLATVADSAKNGNDPFFLPSRTVELLNSVCERTDCSVVVSSTWRKLPDLDTRGIMRAAGFSGRFADTWKTPEHWHGIRGDEIAEWISDFRRTAAVRLRFAIVDDDSDFHEWQRTRLVLTDGAVGMTELDADALVEMLNTE